jgi:hypothetical protein
MFFCCLSAGSLRFLILPCPTEEFCLPCGWLTGGIDHPPDLIGVLLFRMCETQSARMPPLLRGLGIPSCDSSAHRDHFPFIIVIAVSMTRRHAASSKVHLHSSVRFSPCPVASFGSKLPWTLPLAFHFTVTSDAERDWRQPWILGWEHLRSTQHKRPQVALRKSSAYRIRCTFASRLFRVVGGIASCIARSSPSSVIFARTGEIIPPCGVPASVG